MHSISDYYSAVQLRADRWSALRETTGRLARLGENSSDTANLAKQAEELFEALSPIEMYWAFPGVAAFDHLRRQLAHRNWAELSFSVRRVVRARSSEILRIDGAA